MPDDNRKPIILALLIAIVVVAIFVLSTGFGGANRPADTSWRNAFAGFDTSEPLVAADLVRSGGDCAVTENSIVVASGCSFTVAPFGGSFSLGATTKKASVTFVTPAALLTVRMDIEQVSVSQEVERNRPLELSVGRSGGTIEFTCLGLDPCVLELTA